MTENSSIALTVVARSASYLRHPSGRLYARAVASLFSPWRRARKTVASGVETEGAVTKYVALRRGVGAVVDELYNLKQDDEILAEVSMDGGRVLPRNPDVQPERHWWPDNLFSGPAVALVEFVGKFTEKGK